MSAASSKPEPSVPAVPWDPWVGVVLVLAIFFGAQIIAGLLISVYPLLQHWTSAHATAWLKDSVYAQFVYILLAEALTIGAVYLYLRRKKVPLATIGLRRPRLSDVGSGIVWAPVYFVVYVLSVGVVSSLVSGFNVDQKQDIGFNNVHGVLPLVLTFISLVVLPPITEEILVRGFLYSSLKKALPTVAAVIGTSLLFAAAHLPEGGAAGPLYIAALDTFVLSLFLINLRERTGGLYASMTLHAIKNGVAFVALFIIGTH